MKKNMIKDVLVVITGVGYKKASRIFHKGETCELIQIDGLNYKINIGTATAKLLSEMGAKVCMVARNKQVLSNIKEYILKETNCVSENITYRNIDLLDETSVRDFIASLDKSRPIWIVHSIGLGAQAYTINGDNPYLPFTVISPNIVTKEFEVPVKSLLLMIQNLEPLFYQQEETRIVVVTSMSGIRPFMYGYSHASAKGGIHQAVRSLTLELSHRYKSVYVTEILPGIVDTGLYDSEETIKSVQEIGESFGFVGEKKYNQENFPLMPPSSVAEAIVLALESNSHILSINMVAHNQFTNLGA
jgi:short-subunit dehydrogenase